MSTQKVEIKEWHGPTIAKQYKSAGADALLIAAEWLLQESNAGVPLDEGTLERSGVATVDEGRGIAAVSYDTPYAVRQHEDLTARHAPGRHAKYLELAMTRSRPKIIKIIQTQMKRRIPGV